jgi:hypothetical protein
MVGRTPARQYCERRLRIYFANLPNAYGQVTNYDLGGGTGSMMLFMITKPGFDRWSR